MESPVVCIGDIHGHLTKLQSLWKELESSLGPKKFSCAKIIFLGDYVDRGPNSKGVIDFLINLPNLYPQQKHVFLAGNHELGICAFIAQLPELREDLKTLPNGQRFKMRMTWEHEVPFRKGDRETWWRGDSKIEDEMHLQGRRWGGHYYNGTDSIYTSKTTFHSYGVSHGDRQGLIMAMPQTHKDFFRNLDWIHETQLPSGQKLIALHAGLDSSMSLEAQITGCRNKDYRSSFLETLGGRGNVVSIPPELDDETYVVSGHHGFYYRQDKRIIIDEGGGHPNRPIMAFILPSEEMVKSTC